MLPKTPLIEAIMKGSLDEAESLIKSGERIPDSLHYYDLNQLYEKLISRKAFAVLNALLATRQIVNDVYELNRIDESIFKVLITRLPVDEESLSFLENFISQAQNVNEEPGGKTLLSFAFEEKADIAIIRALIKGGCNVNLKNNAEDTLLSQVVGINMMQPEKQLAYMDLLVNEGIDVNEVNVAKQSALHIAVERDKNHLVDILLAHGAQPNESDSQGNTAFYYALAHKFNGPLYKKLAAHTPMDFTVINRNGQTALSEYLRMMQAGDSDLALLEELIQDGADLNHSTPYYDELKSGWDWILAKDLDMFKMALEKTGFDVNTQDDNGNTFLHKLCRVDSYHSQDAAKNTYRKVKSLLDAGADPSITNNKDETPVMLASNDNLKAKTVELLLSFKS
jgi:ankyrin repeat protein